jgi:hypothetical protein
MWVGKVKINIIDLLCFVDTFISLPADFGELAFNPGPIFSGPIIQYIGEDPCRPPLMDRKLAIRNKRDVFTNIKHSGICKLIICSIDLRNPYAGHVTVKQ